jgi:hypothetical protein
MNCQCTWVKDKNNNFIDHILQLLSLANCDKDCLCILCEISKTINCKCKCGHFQTNLINCEKCEKKLCTECIKLSNSNNCLTCINKKT